MTRSSSFGPKTSRRTARPPRPRLISAAAEIDPTVFDADLLAGVQRLLPPMRLHAYLQDLDRQFLLIAEAEASDLEIGHHAHKVVSQAGMLGLTRMSNCAADLENACRRGYGREAAVLACRGAVDDVRRYALPAAEPDAEPGAGWAPAAA